MLFTDIQVPKPELSPADRETLLNIAQASIWYGLQEGQPLAVDAARMSAALREPGASFVTLRIEDELRGCIGSVETRRPLATDVAENAFHAAFHDPRFPPLQPFEFSLLEIHISVLSPLTPISFSSEADLIQQIQPGVDGLVLTYGSQRGLLLPAVWENVPDAGLFLQYLKKKAGLPARFWSHDLQVERFTAQEFARPVRRAAKSHPDRP